MQKNDPHIVVLGAGFGGLAFCKRYRGPGRITLVDRENHHLFQPLLYQVAMAGLSAPEVASPVRSILSRYSNITVLLDEVVGIEPTAKTVRMKNRTLDYDFLVVALGGKTSYFGNDDWESNAPGLKTLEDAMTIRRKILLSFEMAENSDDPVLRRRYMTIVVVGGGPTGVELAGAMAELRRFVFKRDFRRIDPAEARVVLVEGSDRILGTFPPSLSEKAVEQLEELGVEVITNQFVDDIKDGEVIFRDGSSIETENIVWGGGIAGSPVAEMLGAPLDRAGRVLVNKSLSLPSDDTKSDDTVYVVGDLASVESDGKPVPGVAPAAQQMGRFVADRLRYQLTGKGKAGRMDSFEYNDKGSMATIGRRRAVAWIGKLKFGGILAWWAWLVVHLMTLIGFRNKLLVLTQWFYNYMTFSRGARIIISSGLDEGDEETAITDDRSVASQHPVTLPRS